MAIGKRPEKGEVQDVLTFKPVPVKIIRHEDTLKSIEDPSYYLIIKVLRKGPMTVKEIEEAYNKEAKLADIYEPKSDKTLYRYLKHLEKVDLVVPAGKRVVYGKTASETLFARTAIVFITHDETSNWYATDEGLKIVERGASGLEQLRGTSISISKLSKVMQKLEDMKGEAIEKLIEESEESALEKITSGDWEDMNKSLGWIKLLNALLDADELLDGLRKSM